MQNVSSVVELTNIVLQRGNFKAFTPFWVIFSLSKLWSRNVFDKLLSIKVRYIIWMHIFTRNFNWTMTMLMCYWWAGKGWKLSQYLVNVRVGCLCEFMEGANNTLKSLNLKYLGVQQKQLKSDQNNTSKTEVAPWCYKCSDGWDWVGRVGRPGEGKCVQCVCFTSPDLLLSLHPTS